MIHFTCPSCGRALRAKDDMAGKKSKCPGCGHAVSIDPPEVVPIVEPEPAPAAPWWAPKARAKNPAQEALQALGGLAVLVAVGLIIYAVVKGNRRDDARPAGSELPPLTVSAAELCAAFRDNELAAKRDYRGRRLHVRGVVAQVSEGLLGGATVTLSDGGGGGVVCSWDDKRKDEAADLRTGDTITVDGVCQGFGIGLVSVKGARLAR
jgi:hypothetical protein